MKVTNYKKFNIVQYDNENEYKIDNEYTVGMNNLLVIPMNKTKEYCFVFNSPMFNCTKTLSIQLLIEKYDIKKLIAEIEEQLNLLGVYIPKFSEKINKKIPQECSIIEGDINYIINFRLNVNKKLMVSISKYEK